MLFFISPPMPHFIECGERTYPVGGQHPDRSNIGVFDLLVVTRGCHYIAENDTIYSVSAGSFVILRPDRSHYTVEPCRQETHSYWLHFQTLGSWYGEEKGIPILPPSRQFYPHEKYFRYTLPRSQALRSPEKVYDIFQQIIELQHELIAYASWKQQQLFLELLLLIQEVEVARSNNPHLQIAEEAASYLRQHFKQHISYKELSESLHFHANYIAICMKETFGCTPLIYLTKYRVEQAKKLLIYSNEHIGKIAEKTGFGSFPYFIRCFNRITGMKPSDFRQMYRTK